MLHSRRLTYLNEIVRCGSIRKAAERINVAASSINRQILALEEEIGAPIFERMPRGLRLTAAGELYIEHVRAVLKDYKRLEARIRSLKMPQAGKVTMVTTAGLASGPLPMLLAQFFTDHPGVRVLLRTDGTIGTITPVLAGEVDIGLGFNIAATPGVRALAHFDVPIGVVMRPDHRLAASGPVHLVDIVQEKLVLAQPSTSLRDVIDLALAPFPITAQPIAETNDSTMLKQLVQSGVGISLLNPLDVLMECRRGDLTFRPLGDSHVRRQVMKMFTRTRAPLDTVTSIFVEFLISELNILVQELQSKGAILSPDKVSHSLPHQERAKAIGSI